MGLKKFGSGFGRLVGGLGAMISVEATADPNHGPEQAPETNPALEQVAETFAGVESCGLHLREIRLAEEAQGLTRERAYWGNLLADCRNAQLQAERDKLKATLAEQEATLAEQEATLAEQEATLAEQEATLAEQEATLAEQEATLAEQEATLAEQEATLAEQEATLAEQEATLAEQEATLAEQEATLAEQEATLADLDAQLASKGLKVENGQVFDLDGVLLGRFIREEGQPIRLDLTPLEEINQKLAEEYAQRLAEFEEFLMRSLSEEPQ